MANVQSQAKRLLIEIAAIQEGNFENRTGDLLALINEALKDAAALAHQVLDEKQSKKAA